MARYIALTTSDNPHNPITDYDNWRKFDTIEHDYGTEGYFDRVSHTTNELGDEIYKDDIEAAIDEAVRLDIIRFLYDNVHYVKFVYEK